MKIINGILLSSLLLMSGCNSVIDEDVSFSEFVLRSIKAYQDIESFSLGIEYKDVDKEYDIKYDYNYKDKTVRFVQNSEDSYDFYSSIIDYDYYEFYNNDNKYIKVNKEDNAYLKWNNIIVNNSNYLNIVNNLGYQLFSILDDVIREEKDVYQDYLVSYEMNGSSLKGVFTKDENNKFTFEFNNYILTSFDYKHALTGILGDTNTVSKFKINLKNETDIQRPKIEGYTLMNYNDVFTNEVSKDILLPYLNDYSNNNNSSFQIELNKVNLQKDISGKVMNKTETIFKFDYFNKRLYFKSNEYDNNTEMFILLDKENKYVMYDMKKHTYKTINSYDFDATASIYLELYYYRYQTLLIYQNYYKNIMKDKDYKVYSNNSIYFDVVYNGLAKNEIYKFENNLISYYYLEQPLQNGDNYEEVKVKYNKALSVPSFEGYIGG